MEGVLARFETVDQVREAITGLEARGIDFASVGHVVGDAARGRHVRSCGRRPRGARAVSSVVVRGALIGSIIGVLAGLMLVVGIALFTDVRGHPIVQVVVASAVSLLGGILGAAESIDRAEAPDAVDVGGETWLVVPWPTATTVDVLRELGAGSIVAVPHSPAPRPRSGSTD